MLRTRDLFVTTLNEVAEAADNATSSESLDNIQECGGSRPFIHVRWSCGVSKSNRASPAMLLGLLAGGLAIFLFGIGLFGWEVRFRAGAKEVTAMKVHDAAHHRTVLQIHDGDRVVEFPAHSEDPHALGPVNALYNAEISGAKYRYESDAALLGGPLFGALGSLFLLVALVGLRNLRGDTPAADWTDLALMLAGVSALGVVGCWVVASFETGWQWGFSTLLFTLLMTGLAISSLAAVKYGSRSLFGHWWNS